MKLLFITQKLHGQDAFTVLWAEAFLAQGYEVHVLCLELRPNEIAPVLGREPDARLHLHSMGKERGYSKWRCIVEFLRSIIGLSYDRVFIHMTPIWGGLGAPIFLYKRVPVYLWYTHYKMQWGLWVLGQYAKRLFCATPQSLPQYAGSAKKIVTGHGIDLEYWPERKNVTTEPKKLLMVHRLARSKRVELALQALTILPAEYTLTIYGQVVDPEYFAELQSLVGTLKLAQRVQFAGSAPMQQLARIYTEHRFILNFASETIDKTMLEAMTCGCYPVTTAANAQAIGLPAAPTAENRQSIADFVLMHTMAPPVPAHNLYTTVVAKHSLAGIVARMNTYMAAGQ